MNNLYIYKDFLHLSEEQLPALINPNISAFTVSLNVFSSIHTVRFSYSDTDLCLDTVGVLCPLLTHWPTEELHPTMQLSSQECDRTRAPFSTVQRFILTPSSTTTPAPMVTLGPMVQFSPICAVGSCRRNQEHRIIIECVFVIWNVAAMSWTHHQNVAEETGPRV